MICYKSQEEYPCNAHLEVIHRHYHYDPFDQQITTDQTAFVCRKHLEEFLKHIVELKRFIISIRDI